MKWLTKDIDGNPATVQDKKVVIFALFAWFCALGMFVGGILALLLR